MKKTLCMIALIGMIGISSVNYLSARAKKTERGSLAEQAAKDGARVKETRSLIYTFLTMFSTKYDNTGEMAYELVDYSDQWYLDMINKYLGESEDGGLQYKLSDGKRVAEYMPTLQKVLMEKKTYLQKKMKESTPRKGRSKK